MSFQLKKWIVPLFFSCQQRKEAGNRSRRSFGESLFIELLSLVTFLRYYCNPCKRLWNLFQHFKTDRGRFFRDQILSVCIIYSISLLEAWMKIYNWMEINDYMRFIQSREKSGWHLNELICFSIKFMIFVLPTHSTFAHFPNNYFVKDVLLTS